MEIIDGNPRYSRYQASEIIITEFILSELAFRLIREVGPARAFAIVDRFAQFAHPVNKEVIKKAMLFRYENLKRNMSMTDCIGYFLAKDLGIRFLTGDKEFKDMQNVEFVSKN